MRQGVSVTGSISVQMTVVATGALISILLPKEMERRCPLVDRLGHCWTLMENIFEGTGAGDDSVVKSSKYQED